MRSLLSALVLLCSIVSAPSVFSAEQKDDGPELSTRISRYHVTYLLNGDGSFVEERETAVTILKEEAVKEEKRAAVTYSTSIQKADVLQAYTQKKDGRRIDVPKNNYQVESNTGKGKDAPVYSDLTTLTVVFPDVEVGDTLVFSYRLAAKEPMFPGQFSTQEAFPRMVAYDDVRVRIDAPASLWAQHQARGMKEVRNEEKDGRKILEWTYANPAPVKSRRKNYSVYEVETEPGVAYSTFHDYEEIARAYGVRANTKAEVTERIRKLADEIAKEAKSPRDISRALYDWTALNITYAGNCIGLGAVVPRDTDIILDNRMGDCKDHATLLQALLAAKGIVSAQALVNAGSSYQLMRIPVVSMVNHVINYIPSLNLYVDSTANYIPFGMLPQGDIGKPVLLVDGYREGARTPSMPIGSNRQELKTSLTIQPDGSVTGRTQVSVAGLYAVTARSRMRHMKKETEETLVHDYYKHWGLIGSGAFEKDDPQALADHYRYGASFEIKDLIPYPGSGAFGIWPLFYNEAPVTNFVSQAMQVDDEPVDSACLSGYSVEEYSIVLPKGMKVLSIPPNAKISNSFLTFEATYKLKGNTLSVRRVMDDRTPGYICSPQVSEEYQVFARKVLPNLKAQVVYQ